MKKKQISKTLITWSLILTTILTGCGSSGSTKMAESAMDYKDYDNAAYEDYTAGATSSLATAAAESYEEEAYEETADYAEPAEAASEQTQTVAQNRKLIKRVNLTAETQEFDKLTKFVEKRVEELGGYMESADVYSGSLYNGGRSRHANYTARIPVAKMNDLVEDVDQNSNITNKTESAEDVTLQYVDNKSRKEALEVEMDRLMEILKQAEDVDTIIELERRITDVRYEIQNLESQLRTYDNLCDFATVNISISEVEVYTPEPVKKQSDWERMTEGFMHSLKSLGRSILDFFIDIVIALPYLILWGVIILLIVLGIKKFLKGKDKRAEKRALKRAKKEQAARERAQKAAEKRVANAQQSAEKRVAEQAKEQEPELNKELNLGSESETENK